MGGYGSTRWGSHSKKTQVEECRKLTVFFLKPYLRPGAAGTVRWSRGGEEIGSISYMVYGFGYSAHEIHLTYTIGARSGNPVKYDYPVQLVKTDLSWGKERFWFLCPVVGCGRRVGCLYLAPGAKYFACRHCYDLSYETRQEGYKDRAMYAYMAGLMQDILPGVNGRAMKHIMKL
jgi:hypothetical protein